MIPRHPSHTGPSPSAAAPNQSSGFPLVPVFLLLRVHRLLTRDASRSSVSSSTDIAWSSFRGSVAAEALPSVPGVEARLLEGVCSVASAVRDGRDVGAAVTCGGGESGYPEVLEEVDGDRERFRRIWGDGGVGDRCAPFRESDE